MYDFSNDTASSGKPKGKFDLRICEAKAKKSKAGNEMITMKLAITGPSHVKFPVFENFVLSNDIARGRLSDLLDKIEVDRRFESLDVLLNKVVTANLVHDKEGQVKIDSWHKSEKRDEV